MRATVAKRIRRQVRAELGPGRPKDARRRYQDAKRAYKRGRR